MKKTTKKVDILEDPFYSCSSPDEVKIRFRELAKITHPDRGGTHEGFLALVQARDRALEAEEDLFDMLTGE